ncbi:polymerase (RNA) III (DNA directed) polypeptide H, isoform CRA_c [Mus musculus]|nr:polymerase (RNA) III (DNA directed) polypeptide H, isoform CRA_c [Mus musculus]
MTFSSPLSHCSSLPSLMKRSKCGCGSTRRRKERMTCTWTLGRRSASGWWTRALWTHPPQDPVPPRLPLQARSCPRRKHHIHLWDLSVSQD